MRSACLAAEAYGSGKLFRHPGGIWTPIGRCAHASMAQCKGGGEHSYSTNTIDALVARGAAVVSQWAKRQGDGHTFATEITVKPLSELAGR